MADFTVTVPDKYVPDLRVVFREFLGDDADGLTDVQVARKATRRWMKGLVKPRRRGTIVDVVGAVTDAEIALGNQQILTVAAVQARKDAEDAEDASVDTDFGPGS